VKGNECAHGGKGNLNDAKAGLRVAYDLAVYLVIKYFKKHPSEIDEYNELLHDKSNSAALKQDIGKYEKELEKQKIELESALNALERERTRYAAQLPQPSEPERKERRRQSQAVANSLQWNEEKTRLLLIDSLLVQAGWDVSDESLVGQEVEVDFPANPSGKGYVDYVLWDDNGQPLAVVEAKRSGNESLQAGREQARLYADAFERMGKQRPVIFYTNGYETFIWDDVQYNTYRRVYGIYSKDSLQYLIYQRQYRQPQLERFNPDMSITERPYQIEESTNRVLLENEDFRDYVELLSTYY